MDLISIDVWMNRLGEIASFLLSWKMCIVHFVKMYEEKWGLWNHKAKPKDQPQTQDHLNRQLGIENIRV